MSQFDFSVVEEAKSSAKADMDPRLQILIAQMRSGITKTASASTAENEVAVIARVTDADSWLGLSEELLSGSSRAINPCDSKG